MSNGRRWGEDVTLKPGWGKVSESAVDSLFSPMVFVPAAAALLLQIDNADKRISDWAIENTPVAGSNERAERLSKDLRSVSARIFYLSILATPGGDGPVSWTESKVKGVAVQGGAAFLNNEIVHAMKDATGRERPDKSNDESFPSAMSSDAAVFTSFATKNIDTMNIPQPAKISMDAALYALMFAVAWERVEAKAHYPSDVLAGISLGYFISSFANDCFMGLDSKNQGSPVAGFDGSQLFICYYRRF